MSNKYLTPAVRRWAYRVTGAGLGVAAVYGVLNGNEGAAWLLLASALFGVADANVTPPPASS
ncbi:hypothetical protein ACQCX5_14360 [Propionibacteriaceae bacterium G57]|uniref:hypothetical protein n=1 Tax=Aestuariimicrobium sp. G57 TaxID=3418485 RepID=UPI003DA78503